MKFTKDGGEKTTTLNLKLDSSKDYSVSVALTANFQDKVKVITDLDNIDLYRTERK